ncbi:junctional adhesion molecule B-like isoform 1 [Camelus ferus]|nr:junctional adhesion molecule B-like isoform 1 [Camelus ferus]
MSRLTQRVFNPESDKSEFNSVLFFTETTDSREIIEQLSFLEFSIIVSLAPERHTKHDLNSTYTAIKNQPKEGDFKDRAEMIDFSIRIKNVTRKDAGKYRCEVSAPSEQGQNLEEDTVTLEVLVAPAVPSCEVPNSALSGTVVELRCQDKEGNPAPEYTWFKDGIRLLGNPKLGSQGTNSSYTVNTKSGTLQFNTVSKLDSGEYACEARNSIGHRRCRGKRMQVDDLNISGIIAAVVVGALVISVCGLGVCYAQRKGYFSIQNNLPRAPVWQAWLHTCPVGMTLGCPSPAARVQETPASPPPAPPRLPSERHYHGCLLSPPQNFKA